MKTEEFFQRTNLNEFSIPSKPHIKIPPEILELYEIINQQFKLD